LDCDLLRGRIRWKGEEIRRIRGWS